MTKKPIELPFTVSVRFGEPEFRKLVSLSKAGHRNLSQQVRLLIEVALRQVQPHQ